MGMERKSVEAELKSLNEKGEGVLRFIRFHQEDKDSDITLPGFIQRQEAWLIPAHNWKSDEPPLGRGESFEADGATNFRFQLNLDLPLAQHWYHHLKFDGRYERKLQQVSYGFSPFADAQERSQKDGHPVRFLKPRPNGAPGAELREVSFVILGSGNDTAVVDIKESRGMDEPDAPVVEPGIATPPVPADALPSVEDYKDYPEDRRPPLPALIKWLRLYRYHMPFLRDIRKRDGKEVSSETIAEFKALVEEMLEVTQQFNIKLRTAALLPNVEEEIALQEHYKSRHKELSHDVDEKMEAAFQALQAQGQELERRAKLREQHMKKWKPDSAASAG